MSEDPIKEYLESLPPKNRKKMKAYLRARENNDQLFEDMMEARNTWKMLSNKIVEKYGKKED